MGSIKKFFSNFDDTMAAVVFAEAGEHETARQILDTAEHKKAAGKENRKSQICENKGKDARNQKSDDDANIHSLLVSGDE